MENERKLLIDACLKGENSIEDLIMMFDEKGIKALSEAEIKKIKRDMKPVEVAKQSTKEEKNEEEKAEKSEEKKITRESVIEQHKKGELTVMQCNRKLKDLGFPYLKPNERVTQNTKAGSPVNISVSKVATGKSESDMLKAVSSLSTRRGKKSGHKFWKIMAYAEYGVGKTSLAGTLEELPDDMIEGETIFINIDAGDEVLADDCNFIFVDVKNYSDIARVTEFIKFHIKYRDEDNIEKLRELESAFFNCDIEEIEEPIKIYNVVLDTLTELQKYCMYHIMGTNIGEVPLDMKPENPQYKEWGQSLEMVQRFLREYRGMDVNVLYLCARKYEKDETHKFHYMPALPGQLALSVLGFMDMVGYFVIEMVGNGVSKRIMYIDPQPGFKAKNRFKNFKDTKIVEPTMYKILMARKGKIS